MKIGDYKRVGLSMDRRGYENLKRQGRVRITSVDGKRMNVFFMYGESADGDIKIYTDKNNGNITLRGKKEITSEDINFLKEDPSQVLERARRIEERSKEDFPTGYERELGFILMEDEEVELEEGESLENEHLFKGIVFDRERIESHGKLEEYLELKALIDQAKDNKTSLSSFESGLRLGIDSLNQEEGKIRDLDGAHELFELVKVRIYEDKLLLSKIRDERNKTLIYELLK